MLRWIRWVPLALLLTLSALGCISWFQSIPIRCTNAEIWLVFQAHVLGQLCPRAP